MTTGHYAPTFVDRTLKTAVALLAVSAALCAFEALSQDAPATSPAVMSSLAPTRVGEVSHRHCTACTPVQLRISRWQWASPSSLDASSPWVGLEDVGGPGSAKFVEAQGSFVEPSLTTCTDAQAAGASMSTWVGIDGVGDESLEQIGTTVSCDGPSSQGQSAWYEAYPNASIDIPVTPSAGDVMEVQVKEASGGGFEMSLMDASTGIGWSGIVPPASEGPQSSAEWISEPQTDSPSVPMPASSPVVWSDMSVGLAGANGDVSPLAVPHATPWGVGEADASDGIAGKPASISPGGTSFTLSFSR